MDFGVTDAGFVLKSFSDIMKDIEKLEISLYILDSVNKIYDVNYENIKAHIKKAEEGVI